MFFKRSIAVRRGQVFQTLRACTGSLKEALYISVQNKCLTPSGLTGHRCERHRLAEEPSLLFLLQAHNWQHYRFSNKCEDYLASPYVVYAASQFQRGSQNVPVLCSRPSKVQRLISQLGRDIPIHPR